jgi:hypothetical protein
MAMLPSAVACWYSSAAVYDELLLRHVAIYVVGIPPQ